MKVVQTFWSGHKDPLKDDFGWSSPQHHLMSWALSCLCLRENYDEVVLYTDSVGYKTFAEQLQLPYSEIVVQYDNLVCHEQHWAYPKLLTYSMQDKPFIHVDGDVYLPKRLSKTIESGELIAQNREIGTSYYKSMMEAIRQSNVSIPHFLNEELNEESISSYNAGVIGGNDLGFIQKYCSEAFKFIEDNRLDDPNSSNVNINHNILFEQILFYTLSQKHKRTVNTVLNHSIRDNGYTYGEFCDFYSFQESNLLHIIGGHKRNERVCELLSRTLLNRYPEYHKKIRELFSPIDREANLIQRLHDDECIRLYNNFLTTLSIEWEQIEKEDLLDIEQSMCGYLNFFNKSRTKKLATSIKKNPYLSIYEISDEWSAKAKSILKNRIDKDIESNKFDIACIPSSLNKGYEEVFIDDLSYNILLLLREPKTLKMLLNEIEECFPIAIKKNKKLIYNSILDKLEYLFYNKLIYV